jgi:hypothetical protein
MYNAKQKHSTKFTRTRNLVNQITENRRNSKFSGAGSARKDFQTRRKRNQSGRNKVRLSKGNVRNTQFSGRSGKRTPKVHPHGSVPIVSHLDKRFQQVSKSRYSKLHRTLFRDGEGGIVHNYTNEFDFPEIKPPILSNGVDEHGPHVLIMGSESLTPLTVLTTLSPVGTDVGDTIFYLPIAPAFLSNTRMRLLMENYERWKPSRFKITYQPLGDATLGGGVVMVPLTDPDTQLSIGEQGVAKISRAMDYAGSVNFNIYNHAVCDFPAMPEDEEPFFINSGHSARFEFPYAFQVMAQTVFPAGSSETRRDIGWLKIHYEIKLYNPRLPEFSVDNIVTEKVWTGVTLDTIFDSSSLGSDQAVYGVITGADNWGLLTDDTDKIGIMRVLGTVRDFANNVLVLKSPTHPSVPLVQGTILFLKVISDAPVTLGGMPVVQLFTNLDNTFDETGAMTWDQTPTLGNFTSGVLEMSTYDLDHIL